MQSSAGGGADHTTGRWIFRVLVGLGIAVVLVLLGRPVYWKFSAAMSDMKGSPVITSAEADLKAAADTGSELPDTGVDVQASLLGSENATSALGPGEETSATEGDGASAESGGEKGDFTATETSTLSEESGSTSEKSGRATAEAAAEGGDEEGGASTSQAAAAA
eukprot:TRINITY_DN26599_c0_g1_i1.p1 TRINITY_DN26599_c0_g1~~TRINITY_DN26599_c0_g1_i1.p1  ORF type:complete len:164 (-),score=38.96 TRINITY_DN26599_c0_g1_i1:1025-1516(-)